MAGAAEGKGLSDLVSWDDRSEDIDESEVVDEGATRNEASLENDTNGEVSHHESADGFVVESTHASPNHPASAHDNQDETERVENAEEQTRDDVEPAATKTHLGSTEPKDSKPSEVSISPKNDPINDGYGEEEEDLIDYSDEEAEDSENQSYGAATLQPDETRTQDGNFEDLLTPCILPQSCFCSACNDLLVAEYDAINEYLRRRSLTRAAEESLHDQPVEDKLHHADDEIEQALQAGEETVVGDERNCGDEFDTDEAENLTAEDILDSAETVDYDDELATDYEPQQNQNRGQDPSADLSLGQDESVDSNGVQYHDETEPGTEPVDLASHDRTDLNNFFEESNIPADTSEFVDTAESSVTVSADDQNHGEEDLGESSQHHSKDNGESLALENAASSGQNAEPEDEIGYEDDEEDESLASNGVSAPLPAANDPFVTNGKRQRSDAEADDISRGKGLHHLATLRCRSD